MTSPDNLLAQLIAADIHPTELTARLQHVVDDVFEHVIDPKAGGAEVQAKLNGAHPTVPGRPPLVRC